MKGVSLRDVGRDLGGPAPLVYEHTLTEEQLVATENVRKALRDLEKAIWAEDARMRAEVLPSPPAGYRWVSDLVTSEDIVSAGVKVRLQYHLEEDRRV